MKIESKKFLTCLPHIFVGRSLFHSTFIIIGSSSRFDVLVLLLNKKTKIFIRKKSFVYVKETNKKKS